MRSRKHFHLRRPSLTPHLVATVLLPESNNEKTFQSLHCSQTNSKRSKTLPQCSHVWIIWTWLHQPFWTTHFLHHFHSHIGRNNHTHFWKARLFKIARTPQELLRLSPRKLEEILHGATLPGQKAYTMLGIARATLEEYNGELPADFENLPN